MRRGPPPAEVADERIRHARRLAVIGRLTAGVAHDFNNILTVISGTIEILAEAVADRPQLAAIAKLIDEAAARGADLTSHLLAFAHGQRSEPREVDLNSLLVDAARLLRPTLGEQIEIDTTLAKDIPPVLVDPGQLMTVILTLAIDARDAMPEGGKLSLATGNIVPYNNDANASNEAGAGVAITVRACGHGISVAAPERNFSGLAVARNFIGQCNGHIDVCGEAGHGTTVRICLPKTTGRAHPLSEESVELRIEEGDEAILVVENDVLVRDSVVAQIQELGYRTLAVGNAGEALTLIESGEKIDLLFTDVILPGSLDGLQLAIEALNRRPSLKILYTSGLADGSITHHRYRNADALLLAKPYRRADLARMIRTALAP